MNHRQERVSKLIREHLNELLIREIEFVGFLATITDVEISSDQEHAKVRMSALPSEKGKEMIKVLTKRAPYLQSLLHKKLNIRPMPTIRFELDKGPENAARVEKLLMNH